MTLRCLAVALLVVLGACGSGDAARPDAPSSPDAAGGVCAGRPCLTSIDDVADWTTVAGAYDGLRCDVGEDGKYIAPATPTAALQDLVFQDVNAHRLHLDFMRSVLPEYFGGLSTQQYGDLVQRRATRQYWAGALFRLVDAAGVTEGYGFDVIVDPTQPAEQLTEAEVGAIQALLETRFHLPLVYTPTTADAIYYARSFTTVPVHYSRACQFTTCATAGVDCVVVPTDVSVCGAFMDGRTIEVEHARKTTLTATAGTVELPRAPGTYTVPAVFGAGELGPARIPIAPASATATYTVTDLGSWVAHDYVQTFTAGGHAIELAWSIQLPEGGGGFLFEEPYAGHSFYARATVDSSTEYDDMISLSSCVAADLAHWRIDGAMAGGDGFAIDIQYSPPFAGSSPLVPTRGRVTLGGQTTTVDDYFALVYAGAHHNWNNQYWVLFAAPVTYLGHPVSGLWIDEQSYSFELEAAYTLDAAHQPVDTLAVTSYSVAPVAP